MNENVKKKLKLQPTPILLQHNEFKTLSLEAIKPC